MSEPATRSLATSRGGSIFTWAVMGLSVAMLLVNGALGYLTTRAMSESYGRVTHSAEVLDQSRLLLSALQDAETGQRGFLITGAPTYLEPFAAGVAAVDEHLRRLQELTRDSPVQQRRLDEVRPLVDRKLAELRRTIELRHLTPGGFEAARAVVEGNEGKALMDELRIAIAAMSGTELRLKDERARRFRADAVAADLGDFLGMLASVALVGWAFLLMRQRQRERERAAALLSAEAARLRTTLTSIGDAVIVTDEVGRIVMSNGVAAGLTGWSAEEVVGQPLSRVFNIVEEDSRQPVESPVDRVLRVGVVVGLANHTALISRGGSEHPIADSAAPIRDGDGRVTGVVLVFRDQSEERRAERALRESEARLRFLAEALPQLVWTTDERGRLDYFSKRWRDYTGQAQGAEAWEPALHPEDRERVVALWRDAVAQQREFEVQHRLRRADGEFRWFLRRAVLLSRADGLPGSWFGTCTDIHDLKSSQDLLRQADRLKEDFLNFASHEFRTPLTALMLQLQLVRQGLQSPDLDRERMARRVDVIEKQSRRMQALLATLLDVSRFSAGRFRLEPAEMDLADLAREVVARFAQEAEAAASPLRLDLQPVVGCWDRARLDQVITNLVSNAIKYGNHRPVDVTVGERDGVALLMVRDEGIGIAQESLPLLFVRFERGRETAGHEGLGLGLWIARKMVEAHGGEISVESKPGAGSTFSVSLPRAAGQAAGLVGLNS